MLALANLSFVSRMRDDLEGSEGYAREAVEVADRLGDDRASSGALMALGDAHTIRGEHELALERYEEAVALRTRLGDPLLVSDAVYNLGLAAYHAGDLDRARGAFERALAPARELGEVPHIAAAQFMLAVLDVLDDDPATAAGRARESLALYGSLGDARSRARCLVVLACAAAREAAHADAARLVGAAEALRAVDPVDDFERPLLDRYLPELEAELGARRLDELRAEGASLGPEDVSAGLVTITTTD